MSATGDNELSITRNVPGTVIYSYLHSTRNAIALACQSRRGKLAESWHARYGEVWSRSKEFGATPLSGTIRERRGALIFNKKFQGSASLSDEPTGDVKELLLQPNYEEQPNSKE